jgi:Tol biopolymer transport system component
MMDRRTPIRGLLFFTLLALAAPPARPAAEPPAGGGQSLLDPREVHLADLRQLTFGGENAEAYWSPDGKELIFQSTRPPFDCDQIFRMPADGSAPPVLVSTGKGRTTCAYFTPDRRRVVFSSTHQAGPACPPAADRSHGYVWAIYPDYEIWSARPDGSDLVRLTDDTAYDAETTICARDGSMIFTSTRDGDLDLYRMNADGSGVRRLTSTPGYDGGAFFSPDCSRIVWRASRPREGKELDEYRRLLAQGLVRPTQLEIWTAKADGSEARQVTYLNAASFAPSFFPSGDRVLFASNYGDREGREFEIWAVNLDGTGLERVTWTPEFDGFPMFSPDGTRLAFASNRGHGKPGETNVFVARWVDRPLNPPPPLEAAAADHFLADVRWLADDAREGRGVGTRGLAEAGQWLAARFRALGVEPAGDGGGYFQSFAVPVAIAVEPATAVAVDGRPLARGEFQPAGFSASTTVTAGVVAAGYGITSAEQGVDDYRGVDAKGKIVVVRRFTPEGGPFADEKVKSRLSDLRAKAWNAREHGAMGLVVVDLPEGAEPPAEAPLPAPAIDTAAVAAGDAGLPVVLLSRAAGAPLLAGAHTATLAVRLTERREPAVNVVGVLRAGAADRLPGAVLVGAHYDHLGRGGMGSLAPDSHEPHHGADDNASGTAAVLEVARELAAERSRLRRDVYLVAFSGEEEGVLGSTAFTRRPPAGLKLADLAAMLNMDMVGRLRGNLLSVLGGDSAAGWRDLVMPACDRELLGCALGGDGYGPSDHSPFYAAGVPVLHFFTGAHEDYHKPSDTADKINAAGGARVAALVADLAVAVADRPERLAYKSAPAPAPAGDSRSYGAALGTVPDYAGDGRPGVLLAGVRPESAAAKAGLERGDLLVELAGAPIRNIYDLMYALRRAKPGEQAKAVVVRAGARLELPVTFGASQGIR